MKGAGQLIAIEQGPSKSGFDMSDTFSLRLVSQVLMVVCRTRTSNSSLFVKP